MFRGDFDILDIDDKLALISLLIDEHLSSSDLRNYQDNFEDNLKFDKRAVRESKIELKQMNLELVELEKLVQEDEKANEENDGASTKKFYGRGRRAKQTQESKNLKNLSNHQKEIEKLSEYIELTENNIKESENNINNILRLEPLGIDRHNRTHWFFKEEKLPILLEIPFNTSSDGVVLSSKWHFVESFEEYFLKADLEGKYEEKFEVEGKVWLGFG